MNHPDFEFGDPIAKFLFSHDMCIPLAQIMFFVIVISFCLLLKKHSLGLLVTYLFVFYCGFISQADQFVSIFGETSRGMYVYIFSGLAMAVMILIGFLQNTKLEDVIKNKMKPQPKKPLFKMAESDNNPQT